ncbi:hypothetical protein [Pseudomonas vanderleydeniana]|uniref:Uncharacterized protein n=1 Tax=Pseudomonas vanderleydeniana TaxID=2745495 RepID=A0A9E6PJT0_9PSED|nr:hypothetical protein [Pseudomonas vanderleydeniana]QXI27617.1 hypothetical protein HU752_027545 [Pseudomonas vanderleydeniana]
MSDATPDDLFNLLHRQLPDRPSDSFQLATGLDQHRLWLEYDRPRLLLMLARPATVTGASPPEFIVQGCGAPVMLLFDTWFRDQAVKALFVEPCLGDRNSILAACKVLQQRCRPAYRAQE